MIWFGVTWCETIHQSWMYKRRKETRERIVCLFYTRRVRVDICSFYHLWMMIAIWKRVHSIQGTREFHASKWWYEYDETMKLGYEIQYLHDILNLEFIHSSVWVSFTILYLLLSQWHSLATCTVDEEEVWINHLLFLIVVSDPIICNISFCLIIIIYEYGSNERMVVERVNR